MIDITLEAQKFVLVFFRVVSMIWFLPLFESTSVSAVYKAGLSLLIAFLLFESVPMSDLQGDAFLLLIAVGKEVFIGLAMGFFVRVLFSAVSAAGEVISMQSGLGFARSMDPTMMAQSTALEQFQGLLASMIFLGIDGHHVLLKSIAKSLKDVPPGRNCGKTGPVRVRGRRDGKTLWGELENLCPRDRDALSYGDRVRHSGAADPAGKCLH